MIEAEARNHGNSRSHWGLWAESLITLLAIGMAFLFLSVLLKTGYMGDDAYNSQIRGALLQDGRTVFDRTVAEMVGWMKGAGRLFPLGWYHYYVNYYVRSLVIYKSINVAFVMADVALASLLVRAITRSNPVAILLGLMIPTFFQFRAAFDPFLAFGFLLPVIAFYMLGTSLCFVLSLQKKSRPLFYASLVLHGVGLLSYEISYPTFILVVLLAYQQLGDVRAAWRASRAHIALAFIVILASVLLKTKLNPYFHHGYPGAELHLSPEMMLQTFLIQAYAAFPLSYFLKTKAAVFSFISGKDRVALWLMCAGNAYLLTRIKAPAGLRFLMLFGACLWFAPAAIMAISGHQEDIIRLGYGNAYMPVYVEYFGFGIFCLAGFLELYSRIRNPYARAAANLAYCLVVTLFGFYNLGENRSIALSTNSFYLYPRQVLQSAIENDLLAGVPDRAVILRKMRFPHDHEWFYSTHANRVIHVMEVPEYLKKLPRPEREVYLVAYAFDPATGSAGAAYLAPLQGFTVHPKTGEVTSIKSRRLRIVDYPSGERKDLDFGPAGIDFLPMLQAPEKLPLRARDFKPEMLTSRT